MCPAIIGTAIPHNNLGQRLAVSIGDTLIDSGVDAAAGNEQVIQLSASIFTHQIASFVRWQAAVVGNVQEGATPIIDGLTPNAARNFQGLTVGSVAGGYFEIDFSEGIKSGRYDLSDTFESGGQVVIESGGSTLTVNMADVSDDKEPYQLAGFAGAAAFYNAVRPRAGAQAATLTLRDYTV